MNVLKHTVLLTEMQYSAMLAIPHLNSDKINRNQEDKAALITYNV